MGMADGMRWMSFVRFFLVIVSVVLSAFVAVTLAQNCNEYAHCANMQDTLSIADQQVESLLFPCEVKGTELTAMKMIRYEGTFLEDGGDSEVADVAALLLRNNAEKYIYEGRIELKQGDRILEFQFSHLPPNGELLVIEKHRQHYRSEIITGCEGVISSVDSEDWTEKFSVAVKDRRSLILKNLTERQFKNVVVYYKTYYGPAGFYVGGITHSVRINTIGKGEEVQLFPRPFTSEGSAVVRVTVEG